MITVILLVSREFLLDRLFAQLKVLDRPSETNLLIVVDGDLNLYLKCRNEALNYQTLVVRAPHIERRSRSQHFRRKRVAELHEEAKQYIQEGEYVFLIEDDGIMPADTLMKLLKLMDSKENVGFVSGVEVGRWSTPYIGAWLVDDPKDPSELQAISPESRGIVKVNSAGFYCMLVKRELYERYKIETTEYYGPDIDFGFKLSGDGYNNYVDMDIVVDHYRENGTMVNPDNTRPKHVRMVKKRGIWRFVTRVQHGIIGR